MLQSHQMKGLLTIQHKRQRGLSLLEIIVVLTLILGLVKLTIPNIQKLLTRSANRTALTTYANIKESLPSGQDLSQPVVLFAQEQTNSIPFPPLSKIEVPQTVRLNYFLNLPRRDAPSILTFEVESLNGDRFYRFTSIDGNILEQVVRKPL